jgi:hypothetical protein
VNSTERKNLLVRADFILGKNTSAHRLVYHRWRRILIEALPHLLRCAHRCPRAEHVCLHQGEAEGRFSAWLRIPIQRRPSRQRLRQLKAKLRSRLEAGLKPLQGEVLKLGVRRCRNKPEVIPLFDGVPASDVQAVTISA